MCVVNAAIRDLRGKVECSISGNKKVVPRIVLHFEGVAGTLHQTDHRSADFETRLCADDTSTVVTFVFAVPVPFTTEQTCAGLEG